MTARKTSQRATRSAAVDRGDRALSLPVVERKTVRLGDRKLGRRGRIRAIVLITVQILIIAHIVQWAVTGTTISPVEPSESMQAVKRGLINAGAVFFVVALLSTLLLGRWFCGWGCHVVMLQDFCGWLMRKRGVRPKPFRSRLLIYVPLLLALYMFVMPAVYRWGLLPLDERLAARFGADNWFVDSVREVSGFLGFPLPDRGLPAWRAEWQVTTASFWRTFPGMMVAIPFLLICGFATVYFLGNKGFCTYGCPYGGFFAPLDQFSPARIRVTDACRQCGLCTAVCTSNVRVHDEVREYGMVVDPGCMKTTDCIEACPNDALYFGLGRPAVNKGKAKHAEPKRRFDLSLGEELVMMLVFAAAFFAFRGAFLRVPLLMTAGAAIVITYLLWKLWRVTRDESVNLHRFRLKYKGTFRPAGMAFAAIVVVVAIFTAHTGAVNAINFAAGRADGEVLVPKSAVFTPTPAALTPAMTRQAERAIALYDLTKPIGSGGIALWEHPNTDIRLAWLHACLNDYAEAERLLRANVERHGEREGVCRDIALLMRIQLRDAAAEAYYRTMLEDQPGWSLMLDDFARWLAEEGRADEAIRICRDALDRQAEGSAEQLFVMRRLSLLLVDYGDLGEGIRLIERTIELDDDNPNAYVHLARACFKDGRYDEAERALLRAADLAPESPAVHTELAMLLDATGRPDEAAIHRAKAERLLNTSSSGSD